jgi:hypothetical protein
VTDALSQALSILGADDAAQTAQFNAFVTALNKQALVNPNPFTDYSSGMLNGWFRAFSSDGGYTDIAAPYGPGTVGPPPTAAQWAQYDATAQSLGVGGWIQAVIKHITEPSQNFFDKSMREVATIEDQLNSFVPGWSVVIDLLTPAIPILPALTAALGAVSSLSATAVGAVLDAAQEVGSSVSYATGGNVPVTDALAPLDDATQQIISQQAATTAATANDLSALQNFQAVTAHAVQTAAQNNGTVIQDAVAAGVDVAHAVVLGIEIAGAVITFGGDTAAFAVAGAGTDLLGTLGVPVEVATQAPGAVNLVLQSTALALNSTIAGVTAGGSAEDQLVAAATVLVKGIPALVSAGLTAVGPASGLSASLITAINTIIKVGMNAASAALLAEQLHSMNASLMTSTGVTQAQVTSQAATLKQRAAALATQVTQTVASVGSTGSGFILMAAGAAALAAAAGRSRRGS